MSQHEDVLRAARDYITRRGWPVFVLSSSKVPVPNCERCRKEHTTPQQMRGCGCLMCQGFYAATLDVARSKEMVRLHPRVFLAIRTGAVSGTVVIDVDVRGPRDAPDDRGRLLPRTLAQRTGRLLIAYAHPGVRIASGSGKGGLGIDIKSDDAYIVAARPSTRAPAGRAGGWGRSPRRRAAAAGLGRPREPERPTLPANSWRRSGQRYAGAVRRESPSPDRGGGA
jgi:hypothetical protein